MPLRLTRSLSINGHGSLASVPRSRTIRHAKVLHQLGWLYHQDGPDFQNQDLDIEYLTVSRLVSPHAILGHIALKLITFVLDPSDAQSWYLLSRAYMAGHKAYEAYQQAVYRDGRNPTFWCSIGVVYFQINQFRDVLDAYSRAIRINPYIPDVWFDFGGFYESCNNQISDAINVYARAAELYQTNRAITERLQMLKHLQATRAQLPAAPPPQDVHPMAYASAVILPPGLAGPPSCFTPGLDLALCSERISPAPSGGGPSPPVVLDESHRGALHTPLALVYVVHIPLHIREPNDAYTPAPIGRDGRLRSHINTLLHHPGHPVHEQDRRGPPPPLPHDIYYGRPSRAPLTTFSVSPRHPSTFSWCLAIAHGVRPPPGPGQPQPPPLSSHVRPGGHKQRPPPRPHSS